MLDKAPKEELSELLGEPLYHIWNEIDALIEDHYEMDHLWNSGGKAWRYECLPYFKPLFSDWSNTASILFYPVVEL